MKPINEETAERLKNKDLMSVENNQYPGDEQSPQVDHEYAYQSQYQHDEIMRAFVGQAVELERQSQPDPENDEGHY